MLTITGCKTTKVEKEIVLPPKPEREEIKAPKTISDCAVIINYYEHKLQEYEVWADTVIKMIEDPSK